MQASLWLSLLRRIPPAKHGMLVAVTTAGMEFMVQRIFRLEDDYLLMRARLAGTSDQGRIILLPYDQLNSVAYNGILPEGEIDAVFGSGTLIAAAPQAGEEAPPAPEDKPADQNATEPEAEAAPPPEASPRPPTPNAPADASPSAPAPAPKISKSVLLARLRARLSSQTSTSQ